MITAITVGVLAALAVFLRFRHLARRGRQQPPLQYRDGQVVVHGATLGKAAQGSKDAELQAMIDRTAGRGGS